MPKERPILFSGPMVRVIQAGRKTQTRRVMKPQPIIEDGFVVGPKKWLAQDTYIWELEHWKEIAARYHCPYGVPGDHLWVRETWQAVHIIPEYVDGYPTQYVDDWYEAEVIPKDNENGQWTICYRADDGWEAYSDAEERGFRWRPSIFMPRWASRITLEIADVRVEQVQDIKAKDVAAEGWPDAPDTEQIWMPEIFRIKEGFDWFRDLWDGINADRGYGWDTNPWVWVLRFKRV